MSTILLSALVNGVIVSTAATLVVALFLRLVPRRTLNAATRYGIWFVALVIVMGLPVVFIPLPQAQIWTAPPLGQIPLEELRESLSPPPLSAVSSPPSPSEAVLSEVSKMPNRTFRRQTPREWTFWMRGPLRIRVGRWLDAALAVWLIGTCLLLARLVLAYRALLSRRASTVDAPASLQQGGTVRTVFSDQVDTPLAIGFRTPTIMIPLSYPGQFSEGELRQMCVHEAAHLARRDDLTLLAQRIIRALLPWHPAVWWICRELELEREIACDDYVVNATGQSHGYASCLTRVAGLGAAPQAVLATPTVIGNRSDLERRIDALLEKRRSSSARLWKGRFAVLTALLLGFALLSGRMREMFAFAQAGALLGLPPQVQAVADAALDAPPELSAHVLLSLVERGHITDPKQKRQALENVWNQATKAKHANDIHSAVTGLTTESGIHNLDLALKPGLSTAGIQLRAITQMARLDPQAARDMFETMLRPKPESVACEADRYSSHTPYMKALELLSNTFTEEQTRSGERTRFLRSGLRFLANPEDLVAALALLQNDKKLSDFDFVELVSQWSGTLAEARFTDRVFSGRPVASHLNPLIAAAKQVMARGVSPAGPLRSLRTYFVRHASAVRCADPGGARVSIPAPGTPRPAVESARLAFNAAVTELSPDIPLIKVEEVIPPSFGGRAKVVQYINWFDNEDGSVSPDVVRNRALLESAKRINFGTPEQLAANAKREGIPNAQLSLEQRNTPEWNAQALQYLNQLENWSRTLNESNIEVFFQKAYFYGLFLEKVPEGRLRDTLVKSYVTFLATTPVERESPPEWLFWVKRLIDFPEIRDRRQWLDQIEAAGNKTIGLYCKMARLALDPDTPSPKE
jgi:beta-lactamase regulating signal transducer with metallopeptidase domain